MRLHINSEVDPWPYGHLELNKIVVKPCELSVFYFNSKKYKLFEEYPGVLYGISVIYYDYDHPDYGKPSLTISSKYIDKLILDYTQEQIDKYFNDMSKIEEEWAASQQVLFKKISTFTKNRLKVQEKLNRAEELYIEGGITKDRLDKKTRDLKLELAEYTRNIEELDKEYSERERRFFNQKPVVLDKVSFEEKRKYIKQFISKIEIEKEKPLGRRSKVYIHNIYDSKVYVYLLYSQNSKYEKKCKKPELIEVIS